MEHNQNAVSNSDYKCPVCGGSGIVTYKEKVDGYGDIPIVFSRECERCREMRLLDSVGAPERFRGVCLDEFGFGAYSHDIGNLRKIAEDFLGNYRGRWEKAGKGLYLWSRTPGSGKSFFSSCLVNSVTKQYGLNSRFITAPDYLARVGESYKLEPGERDRSRIYRECDLLVLDDIGAQKSGEWQGQEIFRLANERLNFGRPIIFTSNVCPEELNLDARLIDRIKKMSVVLQMPEESIRDREAKAEQERFLSGILDIQPEK